ncbi:MAG: hypothetical protein ACRD4A_00295 [Candidatus Acidiferrales bacterium]
MKNDSGNVHPDASRDLLRHTVATLAYRASKAFSGAREDFADFHAPEASRTPGEIVAHMGDLFDWALSIAKGKQEWHDSPSLPWADGVMRVFAALEQFDAYLSTEQALAASAGKLFQGPVADALTHVGQIAMLRRLAGSPIRGENYFQATVTIGRVGAEQAVPVREFD